MKCRQWPPIEIKIHLIHLSRCVWVRFSASIRQSCECSWCFVAHKHKHARSHTTARRESTHDDAVQCKSVCVAMDTVQTWTSSLIVCVHRRPSDRAQKQHEPMDFIFPFLFTTTMRCTTASHKTYYMICQHVVAHTLSLIRACNTPHRRRNCWCGGLHPNANTNTIEKSDLDFGFFQFESFFLFPMEVFCNFRFAPSMWIQLVRVDLIWMEKLMASLDSRGKICLFSIQNWLFEEFSLNASHLIIWSKAIRQKYRDENPLQIICKFKNH